MPAIEVDEWESTDTPATGYVRRTRGRLLKAVAKDIEHLLDSNRVPCDYWSDAGDPLGHVDKVEFPKGDPYVRLEVGSNEGYSLYLGVTEWKESECKKYKLPVRSDLIRFKLLLTRDDALKAHNLVWIALCSNV